MKLERKSRILFYIGVGCSILNFMVIVFIWIFFSTIVPCGFIFCLKITSFLLLGWIGGVTSILISEISEKRFSLTKKKKLLTVVPLAFITSGVVGLCIWSIFSFLGESIIDKIKLLISVLIFIITLIFISFKHFKYYANR